MTKSALTLKMISASDALVGDLPLLIRFAYESDYYYDVEARETPAGFTWNLIKRPASPPIRKENKWMPFQPHVPGSRGYVALLEGSPVGYAESSFEDWSRLVRIWHFYVRDGLHHRGIGRRLFEAIEQTARHFMARGIYLETQTCNVPAIEFYKKMGLVMWGLNTAFYSNEDIERREVFLWMGKKLQ